MKCRVPSHQQFHTAYGSIFETHERAMFCFACGESWHEPIEPQPLTARESALANIMSADAEKWLYDAILSVYGQLSDEVVIAMSDYIEQRRKQPVTI